MSTVGWANATHLQVFRARCESFRGGVEKYIEGYLIDHTVYNTDHAPFHKIEYEPFTRNQLTVSDPKCVATRFRGWDNSKNEPCQTVRYEGRSAWACTTYNGLRFTSAGNRITQTCAAGSVVTIAKSMDAAKKLFHLIETPREGTLANGTKTQGLLSGGVSHADCVSFEE